MNYNEKDVSQIIYGYGRKDMMKEINEFNGRYRFLSNFRNCPVDYEGIAYQNAEAAFQAQKCIDPRDRVQ